MHFHFKSFKDLTLQELYQILQLREKVFTIEQNCHEPDLDGKDPLAWHAFLKNQETLIAYARLFTLGKYYEEGVSFGRFVVDPDWRGQGIAKHLLEEVLKFFEFHFPNVPQIISAQAYLEKFYGNYGFKRMGEPYQEGGIPHCKMIRHLTA